MMKKTLAILVTTTALTATAGATVWSATSMPTGAENRSFVAFVDQGREALTLIFAEDHDDEDACDEDDDDEDEDEDEDAEANEECNLSHDNSVSPPQNRLFGNSTPPRVQVN